MVWYKIFVDIKDIYRPLMYYSVLPVDVGDTVVAETKHGLKIGTVSEIVEEIDFNPFEPNERGYKAKKHVVENTTKKIYKEEPIMFGCTTVEVTHEKSDLKGIYYTDIALEVGDKVVYEDEYGRMHVGTVSDMDLAVVTARSYIVCKVDMEHHIERKKRIEEAKKLKAKLDAKKKQFQDLELLKLIAASDPETKDMLDQYIGLINGGSTDGQI